MRTAVLALLLSAGLGCQHGPQAAGSQSVLTITTAVGAAGLDAQMPSACVWMIGRAGGAQGLIAVLAHGNVTVQECQEFNTLLYAPGVPQSP